MHWGNLAICAPTKRIYFWEPYGGLPSRELKSAADAACSAHPGWQVICLRLKLQTDSYQCGVWASWFRERFLAYVAEGDFETSLEDFMLRDSELRDLFGLTGAEFAAASTVNSSCAASERVKLRQLLDDFAASGQTLSSGAKIAGFAEVGDGWRDE